jgi:aspartyl-tRNA(Asn)/glutamyl-tRNA(Gln) amidotransferase subunit A
MSKYAQDTFFVTQVIAGYDANDAMSRKLVMLNEHNEWQDNMRGKNIALCPDLYLHSDMQIDVANTFDHVVKIFTDLGANIQTIQYEGAIRLTELFPSISGPEFAQFHRPFYESNPNAYSQAVRERVEWSLKVSAEDYVNGLKERELLRRRFGELINKVDAIISPSLPFTAPLISDLQVTINDKEESCMWLHRPFLNTPNIMGVPGVTIPMGLDHNNLPLSFQITGAELKEKEILEIASSYQRSNPMLLPPLFH